MEKLLKANPIVPGAARGRAVVSKQPLSLWGGLDPKTGEIIDRRHDLSGTNVSGKILLFPHEKGSSTASAILLESIRVGVAPAAIINVHLAPILALGAIVADELYARTIPILTLSQKDFDTIEQDADITISPDGTVKVRSAE